MFCPKCGDELIIKDGELYCLRGDMYLSQNVREILEARYGEISPREPSDYKLDHTKWWCPGCGIKVNEKLECSNCGKNYYDLLYPLVEIHPHL